MKVGDDMPHGKLYCNLCDNQPCTCPRPNKKVMKLYAFQPGGHGEYSFFVMAKSVQEARLAIDKWRISHGLEKDCYEMDGYYGDGDYYRLTVLGEGEVIVNDND